MAFVCGWFSWLWFSEFEPEQTSQPGWRVHEGNARRTTPIDTLAQDKPAVIVTLDAKRRVSIPAALAPAAPGDQFDASFDAEDDVVLLRRLKRKPNWLEVWKQCPVPMDDLPPRSREMPKKPKL